MKRTSKALALLAVAGALSTGSLTAQAALFDRGGGMVYDSDLNITWLQDWNANGLMLWDQANTWANQLTVGGFDDWRLPVAADNWCLGFGCASELAHMFYDEFGATSGDSVLAGTNTANLQLFRNIQDQLVPFAAYWMGTEDFNHPGFHKELWMVDGGGSPFGGGVQGATGDPERIFAVAVRNGDVVISAAPEPETWALMVRGLGALAAVRRRRPGRKDVTRS
jgi:hypothetical protein